DEMLITWSCRYDTGVRIIDLQHREFVNLTNKLYRACIHGGTGIDTGFREAMSSIVEYVRLHFDTEAEILKKMNYPLTPEHKKEHEDLVKAILGAVHEYESGHSFVPNKFARTLKDWVLSHIAVKDKAFGEYLGRHRSDPDAGAVRPEART
ncbi:MAG: bacteriohemerythrin, partial [Treponema sp.]|nr:bacteriohemerythrin [Treponema sp.]